LAEPTEAAVTAPGRRVVWRGNNIGELVTADLGKVSAATHFVTTEAILSELMVCDLLCLQEDCPLLN
jgi:hypothetical protein